MTDGEVAPGDVGVAPGTLGVIVVEVVGAVLVVVTGGAHVGRVMVFVSSVTAPFRASNRPWKVAPVVAVIEVAARTLPTR